MRRWLALLLLVFLPLQSTWAAVASYCGHETGAAVSHVGHHDHAGHAHDAKAADPGHAGDAAGSTSGASGADCGHCLGSVAGMVEVAMPLDARTMAGAPPSPGNAPRAEHVPAQPERPQWAALA